MSNKQIGNLVSFVLTAVAVTAMTGCSDMVRTDAMPLRGATVVAADEFWKGAPYPPVTAPSMDGAVVYGIKDRVHWGLSAARDLTNALAKVTGARVPLVRESDAANLTGPVVYLGPTRAAQKAGCDTAKMKAGAWRIVCDGRRAFVIARTGMGTAYGVTDFLDRFAAYRFLTIDGDDPYVVNPSAQVPVCDFTGVHAFYERHFSTFPYHGQGAVELGRQWLPAYLRRNGLMLSAEVESSVRPSIACGRHCHTYFRYCPPAEHFKDHPEYFSMNEAGVRTAFPRGELCLTNPDVKRVVEASLEKFIAEDRRLNPNDPPTLYDFTQEDDFASLCLCPECRKVIAKYNRKPGGHAEGGDAGLQLEFLNGLARDLRAKHPDLTLRTFAYVSTEELPKPGTIVPEKNLLFWLCDLYSVCDHQLPLTHPFNALNHRHFVEWKSFAPKMEVWDYMLYGDTFPEVSADAIAADMRFFHELGITRIYNESHYAHQPFWELNTYLYSKFFRDPSTDLEKAIDEYCAVYGAGAPKMREAIDFLRKIIAENPPADVAAWNTGRLPWRTVGNMERLKALFAAAGAAAKRPSEKGRVALALKSTCRELVRLYRSMPARKADYAQAKLDYLAAAKDVRDLLPMPPADRKKCYANAEKFIEFLDFRFTRLPEALKGVPESELKCFDLRTTSWVAPNCTRVADPQSECPMVIRARPDSRKEVLDWCLIRDAATKRVERFKLKMEPGPDYRWYRIGVARLGRGSDIFLPIHIVWPFTDHYIECDGMKTDPNWYEFWVSVKYTGDAFADDPKQGLFVDRLLLRRVPEPRRNEANVKL